jgi:hypothetical protein
LSAYLGGKFNKGDEGGGNFRLPEARGEFLRGWDHGRGVDVGRGLGSVQSMQAEDHSHVTGVNDTAAIAAVQSARGLGASAGNWPYGAVAIGVAGTNSVSSNATYIPSGEDSWLKTGPTISLGNGETRPRNIAVMWCIKAWNASINQGNIDITALATLAQQASETNQGTAKVATQAQANAGADDTTIVTPKKLRWGFELLKATNGYLVLPTWLGGLIFQWGYASIPAAYSTVPFTMTYPNACLGVQTSATDFSGGGDVVEIWATPTKLALSAVGVSSGLSGGGAAIAAARFYWFSVGH